MSKIWEMWLRLIWKLSGSGVIGDLLAALAWTVKVYAIVILLLVGVITANTVNDGITAFDRFVVRTEQTIDATKQKVASWWPWREKTTKPAGVVPTQAPTSQLHSSVREAMRYAPSVLDLTLTWWWQIGGVLAFFRFSHRRAAHRRFDRCG